MKFTLSWLKEFLETDASLTTISETLTRIGLEVEEIEDSGATLKPFTVAHIKTAEKHPDADKLQVCQVETADGMQQIVCGAPNARAGLKVALAKVSTVIPTNDLKIKASKIRGVESNGMLCSASELGISEDSEGIIELPQDASVGESIVDVLGLDDPIIEIAITPNRGDCLGVYNIARDLAAAGIGTLKAFPEASFATKGTTDLPITIEDEGCACFIGREIRGVKNGPSPEWLQKKLLAIGLRPISTLVDITNYFTYTYNRPLHVYNLPKVDGGIIVRAANEGETLDALNDKSYTLNGGEIAIADKTSVLGLGGVVGGVPSGVEDDSTDILLECAWFDPIRIAETGRKHQIITDARYRFERTVDGASMPALEKLATQMILDLCGGEAAEAKVAGTPPALDVSIPFSADFINQLGGTTIAKEEMARILESLGFTISGDTATPPSWRPDVTQPADLAEEVLRMFGYDNIEAAPLPKLENVTLQPRTNAAQSIENARSALALRGLLECHHWAFCSEKEAAPFGGQDEALTLQNPISTELSVMRPSLLPHLLSAVQRNADRGQQNINLFEIGPRFGVDYKQRQQTILCAVRSGKTAPSQWQGEVRSWDVFDAKGDGLAILEALGMEASKVQVTREAPDYYHPGRSGAFKLGPKNTLGYFGELHPSLLQALGCEQHVVVAEIIADNVPTPKKKAKSQALVRSDYQAVERDFAFIVNTDVPAQDLLKAIAGVDKQLIQDVRLFDVYAGKGVPEGKTSLALTMVLQAMDRTLTDAEIDAVSKKVIESAAKLGAELRS